MNKILKLIAIICAATTFMLGSISANAAKCTVPEQYIDTKWLSMNIVKGSKLMEYGNYQGITSDDSYLYQAVNVNINDNQQCLYIMRLSNRGGTGEYMTYNGNRALPSDIQHGNGMTLSTYMGHEFLYIVKSTSQKYKSDGGIVRFEIDGNTLKNRVDFDITTRVTKNGKKQTTKIKPTGIAYYSYRGSTAGFYIKVGRKIYDVSLPYYKTTSSKRDATYIMTLSDIVGSKEDANIQGIAYDKNRNLLFEFNQYNGKIYPGDTYIDAYNMSSKTQEYRKVFSRERNGYKWTEVQGMTYTNNKWYFAYASEKNNGERHFCITTQGHSKNNVAYDLVEYK